MGEQKQRQVQIAGISVTVVPDAEAEQADAVICVRKTDDRGWFTDNIEAPCAECGELVVFRPHAPKRPMKICVRCAMDRVRGAHA